MNASPERERDLVTFETAPVEEGPIEESGEPDPTSFGSHHVPIWRLDSYDTISLSDREVPKRQRTRTCMVSGSVMRSYYIIDDTGADVERSWNEPPQELPTPQPSSSPEDDVVLTEGDLFNHPPLDGSKSTLGTPQPKCKFQNNTSSDSSVVRDTPVPVLSLRHTLKISKMKRMINKSETQTLQSQEMRLKSKHNPTLHFKLLPHASSLDNITLHVDIDVPQKYNHILDTAKFKISVRVTDCSASNIPLPVPRPQSQPFTLVQENKHLVFQLFLHTFILTSTMPSVVLSIEVEPIYYVEPERKMLDYQIKDLTDSFDFADIQMKRDLPSEKTVLLTNAKPTISWDEHGVTLRVPQDALPAGCDYSNVTMAVVPSDSHSQAQDSPHSQYIMYGLKCPCGKNSKALNHHDASKYHTSQSKGSLSGMSVIVEKQVSVTNKEQTIELKEHGLTLHVPKDSLPADCNQARLTVIIAKSDPSNQTQDSQHSRHTLYGFKCIDGEQPKLVTLKTSSHCAVDTLSPQAQFLSQANLASNSLHKTTSRLDEPSEFALHVHQPILTLPSSNGPPVEIPGAQFTSCSSTSGKHPSPPMPIPGNTTPMGTVSSLQQVERQHSQDRQSKSAPIGQHQPPVLPREVFLSADNLPYLHLNNYPMAYTTCNQLGGTDNMLGPPKHPPADEHIVPPCVKPTATLCHCTSQGMEYNDEWNDFTLKIPDGAIPEGESLTIDIGVALYGPFQYPEGFRPVSPVFWICVRDKKHFQFLKPVEVTLPHFLTLDEQEDVQSLGLTFLKGDHQMRCKHKTCFQQAEGTALFRPGSEYGVLHTHHFCYLCITSEKYKKIIQKANFWMSATIPRTFTARKPIYALFFVTFMLKTCLQTVKRQIESLGISELPAGSHHKATHVFQFLACEMPALKIIIPQQCPAGWTLGLEGNTEITQSEVDFTEIHEDVLELMDEQKNYPPKFQVIINCSPAAQQSQARIEFKGALKELVFDIPLVLQPSEPEPPQASAEQTESAIKLLTNPVSLPDLLNHVAVRIPTKWRMFGIHLEIPVYELDTYPSHDHTECFIRVFDSWERKGKPKLSWKTVIDALVAPSMNEIRLAGEMKKIAPSTN